MGHYGCGLHFSCALTSPRVATWKVSIQHESLPTALGGDRGARSLPLWRQDSLRRDFGPGFPLRKESLHQVLPTIFSFDSHPYVELRRTGAVTSSLGLTREGRQRKKPGGPGTGHRLSVSCEASLAMCGFAFASARFQAVFFSVVADTNLGQTSHAIWSCLEPRRG